MVVQNGQLSKILGILISSTSKVFQKLSNQAPNPISSSVNTPMAPINAFKLLGDTSWKPPLSIKNSYLTLNLVIKNSIRMESKEKRTGQCSNGIDGAMEAADGQSAESLGLSGEISEVGIDISVGQRSHLRLSSALNLSLWQRHLAGALYRPLGRWICGLWAAHLGPHIAKPHLHFGGPSLYGPIKQAIYKLEDVLYIIADLLEVINLFMPNFLPNKN